MKWNVLPYSLAQPNLAQLSHGGKIIEEHTPSWYMIRVAIIWLQATENSDTVDHWGLIYSKKDVTSYRKPSEAFNFTLQIVLFKYCM